MGLGQKFLTQAGSIFCGSGRVGSGKPFLVWAWIWKISTKNINFFQKISLQVGSKSIRSGSKAGWPLIYCWSKVSSGRVGSGRGPSLLSAKITKDKFIRAPLLGKFSHRSMKLFWVINYPDFINLDPISM